MKEFSSLNGYGVKDATARNQVVKEAEKRNDEIYSINEKITPFYNHETIKFREFDTNCYLTIVKKEECDFKIGVAYDDATFSSGREMTQEFAKRKNADICVNASFWSETGVLTDPMNTLVIQDGNVIMSNIIKTSTLQILCFDENGDMHIELAKDSTPEGLIAKGYVNCLQGFYGIMVNGQQINTDIVDTVGKFPINVIGQKENGDYVFLQSDGRNVKNAGLDMSNAYTILSRYDVKTAYMLDSGYSTSFNNKLIKQNQAMESSNDERAVYTFLYSVKNKEKSNTSLALEEIGKTKQSLREEIKEAIEINNGIFGDVTKKLKLIDDANTLNFGFNICNASTKNTPISANFGVLITLNASADGGSVIQYYVNRNYSCYWTRATVGLDSTWTPWAHCNIPDASGVRPVTFVRGDMRLNAANRPVWYTGEKWVYADGTDA